MANKKKKLTWEEKENVANRALEQIAKSFTECKVEAWLYWRYSFRNEGWYITIEIDIPNYWGGSEKTHLWYGDFSDRVVSLLGHDKRTHQKWKKKIAKEIEKAKLSTEFYKIWKQEEAIFKKILAEANKLWTRPKLHWLEKLDITNFIDLIENTMTHFRTLALNKKLSIKDKKKYINRIEYFYNARLKKR